MKKKYKVIIIGSGPGAATSAYLLAQSGIETLMIEKGSKFDLNQIDPFSSQEINKKYKNGGMTVAYGKTLLNFAEGSCLGGGSEVNSGLFHELPEEIINEWEESNLLTFDRALLKESYNFVRDELSISYMPEGKIPLASLKLSSGSKALGWDCPEVPRWYKYNNDGSGIRQSMTQTLIPKFLSVGGELITNSEVLRIHKRPNNLNSIEVCRHGETVNLESEYLILGAGAINSPHLLKKSKIRRNIGSSLQFHPTFKFIALFDDEVNFEGMGVPAHQIKEFSPSISMGCSISTKPLLAVSLNDTSNLEYIENWKRMGTYYCMITPEGRGKVFRIPLFKDPLVSFSLTRRDYTNIKTGAKLLAKALFKAGARILFPSIINRKIIFEKERDLEQLDSLNDRDLSLMSIHAFSSIPMGGDRKKFPLSPDGFLWEDSSIYVSDSSMLCSAPSVNPQATIMAIARINTIKLISRIQNEV